MSQDTLEVPHSPAPSLCEYAAQVIALRLERMLSYREGVQQGDDVEAVHQMRVWSRRTRAALDVFDVCFPEKTYAQVEREVKQVTGALGAARDLDVMVLTLEKRAQSLPAEQRAGVESFLAHLRRERRAQQKPVEKAISHLERQELNYQFARLVAQRETPAKPARSRREKASDKPRKRGHRG